MGAKINRTGNVRDHTLLAKELNALTFVEMGNLLILCGWIFEHVINIIIHVVLNTFL